MKAFLDTSVLVAAFWEGHSDHEASFALLSAASPKQTACAAHSLAEFYSTITALPIKTKVSPHEALLFIGEIRERCHLVALTVEEYWETVHQAAESNLASGQVYDALLLKCAQKSKAEIVYTWNLRHFQAIRPDLAGRIRTP